MNDPKIMTLLHKIREENYETTKHLSSEEQIKKIQDEVREIKKRIQSKHKQVTV